MSFAYMSRRSFMKSLGLAAAAAMIPAKLKAADEKLPNIVVIYADDLGYGDVSCYGATKIKTPNIDRLASQGLRFTNAHSPSATCTPSRYAMLTGEYAWRRKGTGIARGDARMIIDPGRTTLASVLKRAGYMTGVVGKWHLGLGAKGSPIDWNGDIKPGPQDIGFDYCFLIPATGDRVPCVFVENRRIVGLDPADPIQVSFDGPIGNDPTGKDHPELLKMHPSHGHDQTIVNGISRIGYMSGGKAARWVDEDIADTIAGKAKAFIEKHKNERFFLYFATHDIHVPRVPHPRFVGKSGLGARGDAILQFDSCVGEILKTLDRLDLAENTLLIFTSDNGPVVDDGYKDQSVEKLDGHKPGGPLRGGKYSAFDAGTRVPFVVRWPGHVKPGRSDALVCQIDFTASFADLTGRKLARDAAPDSFDVLSALLGRTSTGRDHLVEHAGTLSLIEGHWKYIEPNKGPRINRNVNIELGNDPQPQLYDLEKDIGEKHNVAAEHPDIVKELATRLKKIRNDGRTR
ncbi:MAG: sulfatase-like hydrolase/transferase [Sedimentisphaerales bacterium]|jgi:arylsulfatase A-like enzyme